MMYYLIIGNGVMNNKGFAISGILYSVLLLFLVLILLILNNFQARKVLFDKQKSNVLEKLEERDLVDFCFNSDLQSYIAPKDGIYKIEVYGGGRYIAGKVRLYEGNTLHVEVGQGNNESSVRTNRNKNSSKFLSCSSTGCYAYTTGINEDIDIDYVTDSVIKNSASQSNCSNSGYIKITRVGN